MKFFSRRFLATILTAVVLLSSRYGFAQSAAIEAQRESGR
jgi:hypothetical protein